MVLRLDPPVDNKCLKELLKVENRSAVVGVLVQSKSDFSFPEQYGV